MLSEQPAGRTGNTNTGLPAAPRGGSAVLRMKVEMTTRSTLKALWVGGRRVLATWLAVAPNPGPPAAAQQFSVPSHRDQCENATARRSERAGRPASRAHRQRSACGRRRAIHFASIRHARARTPRTPRDSGCEPVALASPAPSHRVLPVVTWQASRTTAATTHTASHLRRWPGRISSKRYGDAGRRPSIVVRQPSEPRRRRLCGRRNRHQKSRLLLAHSQPSPSTRDSPGLRWTLGIARISGQHLVGHRCPPWSGAGCSSTFTTPMAQSAHSRVAPQREARDVDVMAAKQRAHIADDAGLIGVRR